MTLSLIFAVALLLAYANGANDNIKVAATLFGTGTRSYRQTLGLATAAQITGSLLSVLLAGALLKTFSGKGLVPAALVAAPAFLLAVGLGGAITVLLATLLGMPISTTHGLVGGIIGAGLALAPGEIAWATLGTKVMLPLLITPLLAIAVTATLYPLGRRLAQRLGLSAQTCFCVETDTGSQLVPLRPAGDGAWMAADPTLSLRVDSLEACELRYAGRLVGLAVDPLLDAAHHLSAFALGVARGLNDTPKILAIALAAGALGIPTRLSLLACAAAMATGGLVHARRLAELLGKKVTSMTRAQGTTANVVASILVIGASLVGSPVSTTHVSGGALFGLGAASGGARWKTIGLIVFAWGVTLPAGALFAYGIASL